MAIRQRLDEIRRMVKMDKRVVVSDLSSLFEVTEETIRRDLDKLEAEGLVTRTYGGAILNQETNENVDFRRRSQTNLEAKRIIASQVSSVIPQHTTLCADASSTVAEALKMLGNHEALTLLTYSVQAIENLVDTNIRLICTGGIVNHNTSAFHGAVTRKILENFNTEYALLSCKALNMKLGIFDSNEEEVELKKRIIAHSSKVILLADSSKFDRVAFTKMADYEQIHMLITDRKPSEEWCEYLEGKGVSVLYPKAAD